MAQAADDPSCYVCSLARSREDKEFTIVETIPGASIKILRENPTSAIARCKAGTLEPAHHHTFGFDLVMIKGRMTVWNLMSGTKYDLGIGDYLFTPAMNVHRVKFHEDTELFIRWGGQWDFIPHEDAAAANAAIDGEKGDDAP